MINCNKRLHYIIFIVERDFLPKNGSNFTIEQQKTRSLISKSQLRILDAVRENVFLEFAILDKAYNDMGSGLPDLPPFNEDGELDYSDCPRPLQEEVIGLCAKGVLKIIDWEDDLLVNQFYDNIKSLLCCSNGTFGFSDYDCKGINDSIFGEGFLPDVFYKWMPLICKGDLSEALTLLSQHELHVDISPIKFLLKAIVYSVKVKSVSLCDALSRDPVY